MENHASTVEKLIKEVENYGKTTLELYKCNAVATAADVFSSLASKLILTLIIVLFLFMINIGAALWIGEILNQPYYGFFIVAVFYLVLGSLLYLLRNPWLKTPINNSVIKSIMKEELL